MRWQETAMFWWHLWAKMVIYDDRSGLERVFAWEFPHVKHDFCCCRFHSMTYHQFHHRDCNFCRCWRPLLLLLHHNSFVHLRKESIIRSPPYGIKWLHSIVCWAGESGAKSPTSKMGLFIPMVLIVPIFNKILSSYPKFETFLSLNLALQMFHYCYLFTYICKTSLEEKVSALVYL